MWEYKMSFLFSFLSFYLAREDTITFKRTAIPRHDTLGQLEGVTSKECDHACLQNSECKSYEYHEKNESCNLSNETFLTDKLEPNDDGWDIYVINPG